MHQTFNYAIFLFISSSVVGPETQVLAIQRNALTNKVCNSLILFNFSSKVSIVSCQKIESLTFWEQGCHPPEKSPGCNYSNLHKIATLSVTRLLQIFPGMRAKVNLLPTAMRMLLSTLVQMLKVKKPSFIYLFLGVLY